MFTNLSLIIQISALKGTLPVLKGTLPVLKGTLPATN
jgi:hypothetical protein